MPQLVLLRHGESQWNLENRFTGWIDVPLSSKGEEEARTAGEKLKNHQFDVAYTSVLKRSIDTLAIASRVAGLDGVPVIRDQALNERHYGDLQGLNKAETAKKFGDEQVHIWRRSYDVRPPNGESLKDTAARVMPYYHAHIEKDLAAPKNVLVVAHGNSLRAMVMHLDQLTREQVLELNIPTGVPLQYTFDDSLTILDKRYL